MKSISDDFVIQGLVSDDELRKAAAHRKKETDKIITISKDEWESSDTKYKHDEWVTFKGRGKVKRGEIKIAHQKSIDVKFEDTIWMILYNLGFRELNAKSTSFTIPRYNSGVKKQIDVYAKDEQTVLVIECKSAQIPHTSSSKARGVRDAINEIKDMRQHINRTIYTHYNNLGNTAKLDIIWIIALKNIDLSENDEKLLEGSGIIVIDDALVNYYQQLASHFGNAAKYMFLGDLRPNRDVPGLMGDPIPAICGKMGGQKFYSFLIEPERLLKISCLAHRGKSNNDSLETYQQTYQRMAKKNRLKKIAKYIQQSHSGTIPGGIFPTSIVINIDSNSSSFKFEPIKNPYGETSNNSQLGNLYLPTKYQSAWIIDGQHRLYAYSGLDEAQSATLPVVAFVDLDPAFQARLFVDINGEQKSVQKNLLTSLYPTLKRNSPIGAERLSSMHSQIAINLNNWKNSMFFERIDDGSGKYKNEITMATIVDQLADTKLIGAVSKSKSEMGDIQPGLLSWGDNGDQYDKTCNKATEAIIAYYNIYKTELQKQWDLKDADGGYINTNTGIRSTLKLFEYVLKYLNTLKGIEIYRCDYKHYIGNVKSCIAPVIKYLANADKEKLNGLRKKSGKGGISDNVLLFISEINKYDQNFYPDESKKYKDMHPLVDPQKIDEAFAIGRKLEADIKDYVIGVLKNEYGEDYSGWFVKGVPPKVQKSVLAVALSNKELDPNKYDKQLYLIDLKEIVLSQWKLFSSTLNLDYNENNIGKEKALKWFDDFNEIRNSYSHNNAITDDDINRLKDIQKKFNEKMESEDDPED